MRGFFAWVRYLGAVFSTLDDFIVSEYAKIGKISGYKLLCDIGVLQHLIISMPCK
jgi:hypothetical protein